MYANWLYHKYWNGGVNVKIALCDFDEKYVDSLLTYLYGKCSGNSFATYTTVGDFEESINNVRYDYSIIGDKFYEELSSVEGSRDNLGKLVILTSSIDSLSSEDGCYVYKYGPMDGLHKMISGIRQSRSSAKSFAVYSPSHHELTEMYGLSMSQMLSEEMKVLLIDTMHLPIIRRLIRDGPRGSIVDVIYKLENSKSEEIKDLIDEYKGVDILPFALTPTDVISISRNQWKMLIEYIDSLGYDAYVFVLDDISQGFKEIIEYARNCVLINKRGDYYKLEQDDMRDFIKTLGVKTTSIELLMSANNLSEGCYQLEELLTGNLGRYVRSQNY